MTTKKEAFVLVNLNLEELALKEIKELLNVSGENLGPRIIKLKANKDDLVKLICRGQSFKRILLALAQSKTLSGINLSSVNWSDFFSQKDSSLLVEVSGVKGQDKRIEISKKITQKIFSLNKERNLKIEYKKPQVRFFVYFNQGIYFLGVDLCGFDLTKRAYRVFPNSAGFRGDWGYYFLRKTGFKEGEKLVIGFVKDGTLAIEAALFSFGKLVNQGNFAFESLPLFKDFPLEKYKEELRTKGEKKRKGKKSFIYAFDNSLPNIRAARKNARLAQVLPLIELHKHSLEDLDLYFKEKEINHLIFQITKKDEDKLNEVYYQASYLLKKKGNLLLIGRERWEISFPDTFKLLSKGFLKKGKSVWKFWLMEKI